MIWLRYNNTKLGLLFVISLTVLAATASTGAESPRGLSAGSSPRVHPFHHSATRARALMARPWSARCYGVARQRDGSRQNSIGPPACFLSGIFRAGSLYPLARGCRRSWRGEGGSGRLDLDLLISGPRDLLFYQPHACARALLARPWSARCYGVARQREGSRQNSIGSPAFPSSITLSARGR